LNCYLTNTMVKFLKRRWKIESNLQFLAILLVFSITGMSTLWVRKGVWFIFGIEPETAMWIKVLMYIFIIFPAYQLMQLLYGFLFGQFKFFWEFEKKMFRRIGLNHLKKYLLLASVILIHINSMAMSSKQEMITLGGGCFWCTEAVFLRLKGVEKVVPGFSGGHIKNPAYREVITGRTGHAEVIQITFDPSVVSVPEILEVFFLTHDPTTLNRQGADVGTQYRSAIFYHSEAQKKVAFDIIQELNKQGVYPDPVVTEVTQYTNFYPAEDYHVNYFERNRNQPYCQYVVAPKVAKFEKIFRDKMK